MRKETSPHFDYIITEVEIRNQRSMKAHYKVGFKEILEYKDENGKPYLAYGHDYHPDLPTDGNFLNNGLVDPYRNPHPHLSEVKKVYEPVQLSYDGNGVIQIQTQGGIPPYQYSTDGVNFSNNDRIIGLEAGTYDYYVRDDNGCIFTNSATIFEPNEFTVDLGADITIEFGEQVNLFATTTNVLDRSLTYGRLRIVLSLVQLVEIL